MAAIPINFYQWRPTNLNGSPTDFSWQPVASHPQDTANTPQNSLRLVTWNVWYEDVEQKTRFSGFLDELLNIPGPPVDIIALQEVTRQFLEWLQLSPSIRSHWLLTDRWDEAHHKAVPQNWYGTMFLVRRHLAGNIRGWAKKFPTSKMGRFVEMVEIFHRDTSVVCFLVDVNNLRRELRMPI